MMNPATSAGELLRPDLLGGVSMFVVAADDVRESAVGLAVREACMSLGASVVVCEADADTGEKNRLDAAVADVVERMGGIDMLVVDGAGLFTSALGEGGDGHAALRACMDGAWDATRAVVNHAFLRAAEVGGRVVYVAPSPDAGEHADAVRAGLENLARTLSIEWARHDITTVAIAPGAVTTVDEVATLIAYLASAAGAYFSGCQLDLRAQLSA